MIGKYITRQIILTFINYLFIITFIFVLSQTLRFLYILSQGFGIKYFILLYVLLVPNTLVNSIPIVGFVSTLFVYTRLNQNNELIILKNFGYSYWQLLQYTIYISLALTAISLLLLNVIKPWANQTRSNIERNYLQINFNLLLKPKNFFTFNDRTFYVSNLQSKRIYNVFIYNKTTANNKPSIILAKYAQVIGKKKRTTLTLVNGQQYFFNNFINVPVDKFESITKTQSPSLNSFYKYSINMARKNNAKNVVPTRWKYTVNLFPIATDYQGRKHTYQEFTNRFIFPFFSFFGPILGALSVLLAPFERRSSIKHISIAGIALLFSFLSFSYLLKDYVDSWKNFYYPMISPLIIIILYFMRFYRTSKKTH